MGGHAGPPPQIIMQPPPRTVPRRAFPARPRAAGRGPRTGMGPGSGMGPGPLPPSRGWARDKELLSLVG